MDPKDASQIVGFLNPEFTQRLPNGRTLNGLTPKAFQMVMSGYACGECMAMFATFKLKCPVCGTMHNPQEVVPAPQLWVDHLAERYAEEPPEKPPVVNPFDAIKQHLANPEVEKTPLHKLRNTKKRSKK